MKKIILLLLCTLHSFASDPITIDSLFKRQLGLRSISTLEYISSGNTDFYKTYPYVSAYNDGKNYTDNRQLSLRQTLVYSLHKSFDLSLSARGSYVSSDYRTVTGARATSDTLEFNSFNLGFIYTTSSIRDFIPQFSFDFSLFDRIKMLDEKKNFTAKSASLQFALKRYTDPLVAM
ncbi:nucleoid-structuring protein H-NS [Campylobacter sp. MIT 21-1685]|uniref:nucleoid-structuring protein H-NS n=1 Tax=unclassified Campylobacter TaxID=2593542 RepID=UPI00224AB7C5|nr:MULTISPECIES: nucleoid-structuring protein H-NS [unclassified Campylobacter]MCX2682967.1 nucleoid-structuring protein H-NS [Campylobacter sp. MIT 21-1684]MCX2751249.1 nucleoid-structuring protein H-NS [Campylobacter sp. MIT 21-1682]MCX2807448.1 nucleoid-structuring protein H-NS [Campylobacter sp. MIT 21-1685]